MEDFTAIERNWLHHEIRDAKNWVESVDADTDPKLLEPLLEIAKHRFQLTIESAEKMKKITIDCVTKSGIFVGILFTLIENNFAAWNYGTAGAAIILSLAILVLLWNFRFVDYFQFPSPLVTWDNIGEKKTPSACLAVLIAELQKATIANTILNERRREAVNSGLSMIGMAIVVAVISAVWR